MDYSVVVASVELMFAIAAEADWNDFRRILRSMNTADTTQKRSWRVKLTTPSVGFRLCFAYFKPCLIRL